MIANSGMKHGTKCFCATCFAPGTWDEMNQAPEEGTSSFEDAVFLNRHNNMIECYDCWLK